MDCAEALELLLDRELLTEPAGAGAEAAPERRQALEAHLRACASCAAQATGLDRALGALRAADASAAAVAAGSIDLWPDLRATLAAEGRLRPVGGTRVSAARWRWTRVASFASAAAVLAIALPLLWKQVGRSGSGGGTPTTDSGAPVALGSNSGTPLEAASEPSNLSPEPEPQLAADAPALDQPADTKAGLRRAPGEERRRDFAVPYESSGENGAWSLASDRELR